MNGLGLAAPNGIRCRRTPVARPCRGSLRPRGLVVDNVCETCGRSFVPGVKHRSARYCTLGCYRSRGPSPTNWIHPALTVPRGMDVPHVETSCIHASGWRQRSGYYMVTVGGRRFRAHRYAWERANGPIPKGMVIGHLCRNKACVNVDHLEMTTVRINTLRSLSPSAINARKTHCLRGHKFSSENTYIQKGGKRGCRACNRLRQRRYAQAKRSVA